MSIEQKIDNIVKEVCVTAKVPSDNLKIALGDFAVSLLAAARKEAVDAVQEAYNKRGVSGGPIR